MAETAGSCEHEDVFCFRPDAPFYVQAGLSALGALVGAGMVLATAIGPLGVGFGIVGIAVAAIGGRTLFTLRRTWVNRPELHLSAYGVWVATVRTNAGLRWAELSELGVTLHQGAEHLLARPADPAARRTVALPWSEDLRAYVVAPLDGWDRPEAELRAAARAHAGRLWSEPLDPT